MDSLCIGALVDIVTGGRGVSSQASNARARETAHGVCAVCVTVAVVSACSAFINIVTLQAVATKSVVADTVFRIGTASGTGQSIARKSWIAGTSKGSKNIRTRGILVAIINVVRAFINIGASWTGITRVPGVANASG